MSEEEQKQAILDAVNAYLEEGTPADALERLNDLIDELYIVRDALRDDIRRAERDQ